MIKQSKYLYDTGDVIKYKSNKGISVAVITERYQSELSEEEPHIDPWYVWQGYNYYRCIVCGGGPHKYVISEQDIIGKLE